jgi:hypothetical protein
MGTVATIIICSAARFEPGGPPPPSMRPNELPPLMTAGDDNELITVPAAIMRKTLRWAKDRPPRIRTEMRRLESEIDDEESCLRIAVFRTFDRNWERCGPDFDRLVKIFELPGTEV